MSNSILEIIRSKHEEIEHLEKGLSKALAYKENNPSDRVTAELVIKRFIEDIQKQSKELLDLYSDKDGIKKEEIDILAGNKNFLESSLSVFHNSNAQTRTPDVWHNFYEKIREMKVINKRVSGNEFNENLKYEKIFNNVLDEISSKQIFTAEENRGKCVDMHEIFLKYLNFKKLKESKVMRITDYLSFLSEFDKFEDIPIHIKKSSQYKEYVLSILDYFKKYFIKSHPLIDFNEIQDTVDDEFEKEWKEGTVYSWEKIIKGFKNSIFPSDNNSDNVNNTESLFCIPCNKKFANESVLEYHKKGKSHLKNIDKFNQQNTNLENLDIQKRLEEYDDKEEEICRSIAYYEFQILRYKELLGEVFENTKNLIRKKQSRNYDENEANFLDNQESEPIINDDDEQPLYNPKNVPLGWDGKPIPYWLFKLHGLGVEFKCEICGGASYWGRRAFERHFQEWRHSYGMKCLKIPNTVHFKEVTSIEDALRLHQSFIEEQKKTIFKPEIEEEFEDSEGNIVNKKMYFDLKRQGLL